MPQRCVAPTCVCSKRSEGKCTKPNHWNLFRTANRGRYKQTQLSTKYKTAKRSIDDAGWCDIATDTGLDECLDTTKGRNATDGTNTCKELLAHLVAQDAFATAPKRWERVMRILHTRSFPNSVLKYSTAQTNFIANVVGDAFFGKEFVPFLRSTFQWKIEITNNLNRIDPKYIVSITHHEQNITRINGSLIDAHMGVHTINNDGIVMHSTLEWVAHFIAHELLHCLLVQVCRKSHRHNSRFQEMNKHLLRGPRMYWKIVG